MPTDEETQATRESVSEESASTTTCVGGERKRA